MPNPSESPVSRPDVAGMTTGYYCEYCGEGHAERPKILHSALCKIFQFNNLLAALGGGGG